MPGKFGCCDTCLHFDSFTCDECEDAKSYEFDEDLIELGDDGRMCIRSERLEHA